MEFSYFENFFFSKKFETNTNIVAGLQAQHCLERGGEERRKEKLTRKRLLMWNFTESKLPYFGIKFKSTPFRQLDYKISWFEKKLRCLNRGRLAR